MRTIRDGEPKTATSTSEFNGIGSEKSLTSSVCWLPPYICSKCHCLSPWFIPEVADDKDRFWELYDLRILPSKVCSHSGLKVWFAYRRQNETKKKTRKIKGGGGGEGGREREKKKVGEGGVCGVGTNKGAIMLKIKQR